MHLLVSSSILFALAACNAGDPIVVIDVEGGPFCALDGGIVPAPAYPDPCVVQCTAQRSYCQGPLPGGGGWGCCANPPLADGAPNPNNDCTTALCGRK